MNKIAIWVFFLVLFAACAKETDVPVDKTMLSYLVYAEEALAKPIATGTDFKLISKNSQGIFLTKIDSTGYKTNLLEISSLIKTASTTEADSYSFLPTKTNGNYIVYTNGIITSTDTIPAYGIIKTDENGVVQWQKNNPIDSVNNRKVNFANVFVTPDDGLWMVFATERSQQIQNMLFRFSLFDAIGNNTENNISAELANYYSNMQLLNNKLYVFVQTGGGGSLPSKTFFVLNTKAVLEETKTVSIAVSEINSIFILKNGFVLAGKEQTVPGAAETSAVLFFNSNFELNFSYRLEGSFAWYSVQEMNDSYLITGAKLTGMTPRTWSEVYSQTGTTPTWVQLNSTGQAVVTKSLTTEFPTMAVGAVVKNNNAINILAVRKSFGIYNDMMLIKSDLTK